MTMLMWRGRILSGGRNWPLFWQLFEVFVCDAPDFFDMPASSQKSKFVVDDKVPSTWYNQTDWLVDLIVIVDYNVYRDCTSVQNLLP